MTPKATHVVAVACCKAALLLLLACATHGSVETPESVHRRASFQLDTKRLSQAMWLDGAVNHGVPSTFACSSLEGAACLYSAPVQARFAQGVLAPLLIVCLQYMERSDGVTCCSSDLRQTAVMQTSAQHCWEAVRCQLMGRVRPR